MQTCVQTVIGEEVDRSFRDLTESAGALVGDRERGINAIASPFARTLVAPLDLLQTRRQIALPASLTAPYSNKLPYSTPYSAAFAAVAAATPPSKSSTVVGATVPTPPPVTTLPLKRSTIRRVEGGWSALWKGNGMNCAAAFSRYTVQGLGFRMAETQKWFGEHKDMTRSAGVYSVPHVAYVAAIYIGVRYRYCIYSPSPRTGAVVLQF